MRTGTCAAGISTRISRSRSGGREFRAGGVRIAYEGELADVLINPDEYPGQELQAGRDTPEIVLTDANHARKFPFCLFSVQLRTEKDSRFLQRIWEHENPLAPYTETEDDHFEHPSEHLYELDLKPMSSWEDIPTVESTPTGEGFFGPGEFSDKGISHVVHSGVPLAAPASLGDLRGLNLAVTRDGARASHVIGNSRAHPRVPLATAGDPDNPDWKYLANDLIWDGYYFSGLTDRGAPAYDDPLTRDEAVEDFVREAGVLPDRRMIFHPGSASLADVETKLKSPVNSIRGAAAHQLSAGMFNVNSTSVEAWEAVYRGLRDRALQVLPPDEPAPLPDGDILDGTAVSRTALPNAGTLEDSDGDHWFGEAAKWRGYRELSDDAIRELAEATVTEVKKRGPFLSLAEFVNRRLEDWGELAQMGAVQAAIDACDLNAAAIGPDSVLIQPGDVATHGLTNPEAALGYSGAGAPGFISQADVLAPISNGIAVRSDTFRIRAYGEVAGADGEPRSRAWCEAIVQRFPEYVDESTPAESIPTSPENSRLGRRFRIVHLRWLSPDQL